MLLAFNIKSNFHDFLDHVDLISKFELNGPMKKQFFTIEFFKL